MIQQILNKSNLEAVRGAASILPSYSVTNSPPSRAKGGGPKLGPKPTVARGFIDSMAQLSTVLEATNCNFVRYEI